MKSVFQHCLQASICCFVYFALVLHMLHLLMSIISVCFLLEIVCQADLDLSTIVNLFLGPWTLTLFLIRLGLKSCIYVN